MSVSRSQIRSAVKDLIARNYSGHIECVRDFDADPQSYADFCLVYFVEGDYLNEGIRSYAEAQLKVVFFQFDVDGDDDLDSHEAVLLQELDKDCSLGGLVRSMLPSGFSFDDSQDARLSCLSLSFVLDYECF